MSSGLGRRTCASGGGSASVARRSVVPLGFARALSVDSRSFFLDANNVNNEPVYSAQVGAHSRAASRLLAMDSGGKGAADPPL